MILRVLAIACAAVTLTACAAEPISGRSSHQPAMATLLPLR